MRFKLFFISLVIVTIFAWLQAGWNLQHSGTYQLYDIDFPRANTTNGYACGEQPFQTMMLFKTTTSGDSWEMITTTLSSFGNLNALDFPLEEATGYIAGDSGKVAITSNGGIDWTTINTGTNQNLNAIHFPFDNEIGYVVGMRSWVARTFNNGLNWEDRSVPISRDLYGLYFATTAEGWVVGEQGAIAHTANLGDSWEIQNSGVTEQLLSVYFRDASIGWVVGTNKTCLKTTNAGQTWTSIGVNIPFPSNTNLYSVVFPVNIDTGFVCGSSGRIAKTTDQGDHWDTTTLNPPSNLYRIEFPIDNQTGWVCGSGEVIFKTTDGGQIWLVEQPLGQQAMEKIILSTPNPFRTATKILVSSSANRAAAGGLSAIQIYDCSGKLVKSFAANNQQLKTNHYLIWDGFDNSNQKVQSGIYLLELRNNKSITQRLKLVLLD